MQTQAIPAPTSSETSVHIPVERGILEGVLTLTEESEGLVILTQGNANAPEHPGHRFVTEALHELQLGTLIIGLLTPEEEAEDGPSLHRRLDIPLLTGRLIDVTRWATSCAEVGSRRIGYFGSSTSSAAAWVAAANLGRQIRAIVSWGGRPDLAGSALWEVTAPTLLLVGGLDRETLRLNRNSLGLLRRGADLRVIPGAVRPFEEPESLEPVSRLAGAWFVRHLGTGHPAG